MSRNVVWEGRGESKAYWFRQVRYESLSSWKIQSGQESIRKKIKRRLQTGKKFWLLVDNVDMQGFGEEGNETSRKINGI